MQGHYKYTNKLTAGWDNKRSIEKGALLSGKHLHRFGNTYPLNFCNDGTDDADYYVYDVTGVRSDRLTDAGEQRHLIHLNIVKKMWLIFYTF